MWYPLSQGAVLLPITFAFTIETKIINCKRPLKKNPRILRELHQKQKKKNKWLASLHNIFHVLKCPCL